MRSEIGGKNDARNEDRKKERNERKKQSTTRTRERRLNEDAVNVVLFVEPSGAKNSTLSNSWSFSERYWHSSRVLVTCLVTVTKLDL